METRFSILLLAIFIAIPLSNVVSLPMAKSRCLLCDDFNRESNNQCVNNYDDCGKCKAGFIEDFDDPRLCLAIEIIETPENVNLDINSDTHLPCKFTTKVGCYWKKNDQRIQVTEYSKYEFHDLEAYYGKSKDCSLRISKLTEIDQGKYVCGSLADSNSDSVESQAIHLTIKIPTIVLSTQITEKVLNEFVAAEFPTTVSFVVIKDENFMRIEDENGAIKQESTFFEAINLVYQLNTEIVILLSAILFILVIFLIAGIFILYSYLKKKTEAGI